MPDQPSAGAEQRGARLLIFPFALPPPASEQAFNVMA